MTRLEEMTRGSQVKGIRNDGPVEVLDVKWFGTRVAAEALRGGLIRHRSGRCDIRTGQVRSKPLLGLTNVVRTAL